MLHIPIDVLCSKVNYLEHVQLVTTIEAQERGRLQIVLQSPSGIEFVLICT